MTSRTLARAVLAAVLGVAGPALADPCETIHPEAGVPVRTALGPADLGALPEACAQTSVGLDTRGILTVAEEDFYGSILAGGSLRVRWALPGGPWLSLWVPGLEYRLVANASIQPTSLDLGAGAVGAHVPLRVHRDVQLAPYARVLVPSETVLHNAVRTGFEVGESLVWRVHSRIEVVGGVVLPVTLTTVGASTHPSFLPTLVADVGLRPWGWLGATAGLGVRFADEPEDQFESLDPRAALRFYPWRGLRIDLSGVFPILGRDRTDAAAFLSIGWIVDHGS